MAFLRDSLQIHKLASDLGTRIRKDDDPVAAILKHCEHRIKTMLVGAGDDWTLTQLLDWIANRLSTSFEVIRSDKDLYGIKEKYIQQKETAFVQLEDEFSHEVFGVTFKLHHSESWEHQYVSVIDCRDHKAARGYFTKWHELAHLLTQTDQMRLIFRRTHASTNSADPEERLMEVIAGTFGFYQPIVRNFIKGDISFEAIESLRQQLCPEASWQSSLINFSKRWNSPCILVRAEMGLKRSEETKLNQNRFDFMVSPETALRAIHVTANDLARDLGLLIHENMRIPQTSVIHRAFTEESSYEADEDLSSWETSRGGSLKPCHVRVQAKWWLDGVDALIIPT